MSESAKTVGAMDVFLRMVERDDKAFKLAPMSNIIGARKVKLGTQVTIGVGDDICLQIAEGSLVGGFIFCDRKRFEEVKAELVAEATR
jgi:hypothetical protein